MVDCHRSRHTEGGRGGIKSFIFVTFKTVTFCAAHSTDCD